MSKTKLLVPKTKILGLTLLCAASINLQQSIAQTSGVKQTSQSKTSAKEASQTGLKQNSAQTSAKPTSNASTKPASTSLASTSSKSIDNKSTNNKSSDNKSTGNKSTGNSQSSVNASSTKPVSASAVKTTSGNTNVATTNSATSSTAKSSIVSPTSLKSTASNQTITRLEESSANTAVNLLKEKQAVISVPREMIQPPYTPKLIDVTDQTIRLGGGKKEELMFGFAAGDKIIFNFQEADSKDLKEIEIIEYPTLSRFSDYKTSRVKNKEIIVSQQGVFIFRLKNSSLAKRICKIRIQRVPASASTEKFNSSVSWINKQDTIWQSYTTDVVIGYDTTYIPKTKKVLVRSEVEEQLISDEVQKINSQQNIENRNSVVVSLPVNNRAPYKTTRVISWAYWVGAGPDANRAWQQNLRAVRSQNMDYYTPLGAYANNTLTSLVLPKTGQQLNYFIADQTNRDLFMQKQPFRYIDDGKGFGGYRKFTNADQCQGSYNLCFENLSPLGDANVIIKVIAMVEKTYFEDQAYEEQVITPITEKQIKQQPSIRNTNLPVTGM